MSYHEHYQQKIAKDPQNIKWRLSYLGEILQNYDHDHLRPAIRDALEELVKGPLLPERYHKPVLKSLKRDGLWNLMEMLCRDIELCYGEDIEEDESLKRMIRAGRKTIREVCPVPCIGPKVKGEDLWKVTELKPVTLPTPRTLPEEQFPCYIQASEDEGYAILHILGHEDDNYLSLVQAVFPIEEFHLNLGGGEVGVDKRVVMTHYRDGTMRYYFKAS